MVKNKSFQARLHQAQVGKLWRDIVIIIASVAITMLLVRMGALESLLTVSQSQGYIESFVAGIFFTSVFTIAPSAIALATISLYSSPIAVAFWGGLGAMFGDLILFLFIRDIFVEDLKSMSLMRKITRYLARPHFGFLRWVFPFLGALIIASPLPDELGLALLGFARTSTIIMLPITFAMNFIGILLLAELATHVMHVQ